MAKNTYCVSFKEAPCHFMSKVVVNAVMCSQVLHYVQGSNYYVWYVLYNTVLP
jgi:hypothetical protein